MNKPAIVLFAIGTLGLLLSGCIKGPMWRTGYISPWAQQRWAEEERIAPTLFAKRDELAAMVYSAHKGTDADRERTATQLAQVAQNDPVLLVRLEAVKLLGDLDTSSARSALMMAAKDPQSDIRLAAVHACAKNNHPESVVVLQEVIGGDADIDIRLAATRTLADFKGPEAVRALGLALEDPNPALQLRAADSLRAVTGENFGHDVRAWQAYVQKSTPANIATQPERMADQPEGPGSITR